MNRLLFLAGVGSLQSFALYFLQDVLHLQNAAGATGKLMMFVGLFTVVAALPGGYLSDKFGRKRLLVLSGIVAGLGTGLLFISTNMTLVTISGCIIGVAVGIFDRSVEEGEAERQVRMPVQVAVVDIEFVVGDGCLRGRLSRSGLEFGEFRAGVQCDGL